VAPDSVSPLKLIKGRPYYRMYGRRQGIIATETEIKKWKGQRDEKEKARVARETETSA
jgi:hypothetical protein